MIQTLFCRLIESTLAQKIRRDSDLIRQVGARTLLRVSDKAASLYEPQRTYVHTRFALSAVAVRTRMQLARLICRLQLQRRQSSLAQLIEFSPRDRRERSRSSLKDLSQTSSLCPRQKAGVLHDRIAIIRAAAAAELLRDLAPARDQSHSHGFLQRAAVTDDHEFLDPGELNGQNSRNRASIRVSWEKAVVYES